MRRLFMLAAVLLLTSVGCSLDPAPGGVRFYLNAPSCGSNSVGMKFLASGRFLGEGSLKHGQNSDLFTLTEGQYTIQVQLTNGTVISEGPVKLANNLTIINWTIDYLCK